MKVKYRGVHCDDFQEKTLVTDLGPFRKFLTIANRAQDRE